MSRSKTVSLYLMSFFYVLAGFNHFKNPEFYLKMMPPYLPAHAMLNALSGAAEMILGMMLIRPATRSLAAWGLILLLIAVFPANIHMALAGGEAFGLSDWILYARLPFQFLLILCAYAHTKNPDIDSYVFETEVTIQASIETVWSELVDFSRYSEWNPFIVRAVIGPADDARDSGVVSLGSVVEFTLRHEAGADHRLKNVIVQFDAPLSLAWRGSFLRRGLLDITRFYRLERFVVDDVVSVRLIHGERFEGIFSGLLASLLSTPRARLMAMNVALKSRCESRPTSPR